MSTVDIAIVRMERAWNPPNGVLWSIRTGHYDPGDGDRFLELLKSIRFSEEEPIPRRLVSLIWYVPIFLEWQRARIRETGADSESYCLFVDQVCNEIESILGVP